MEEEHEYFTLCRLRRTIGQQHLPTGMSDVAMAWGWNENLKRRDDVVRRARAELGTIKRCLPSGFWESASLGMVYKS